MKTKSLLLVRAMNIQPAPPEHKPDEPTSPDSPSLEETPSTKPKHFPIHREIPDQPIYEPIPDRPRA